MLLAARRAEEERRRSAEPSGPVRAPAPAHPERLDPRPPTEAERELWIRSGLVPPPLNRPATAPGPIRRRILQRTFWR
ncbi:DUF6059 family protein [Micromonospora sp. NPDC048898]|uniref:DUF6059 family protein n=1 Tax=Micromonospora sp. NPDC048898 TaxID=3364260 RepID=UPI00371B0FA9